MSGATNGASVSRRHGRPIPSGIVIGNDFRVGRLLGEGRMGSVFEAVQFSTGRTRALKVLRAELVQQADQRRHFAEAAKSSARIQSEHVVQVVASGIDRQLGVPWLAMEFLDGEPLASWLEDGPALSLGDVRELFVQLGRALRAAHAAGIVHRNLRPEKLFIGAAGRPGVAFTLKVLDFGVAKFVQEARAAQTAVVGNPLWIAPEQATVGAGISAATDVWSVGLLAFRLITGEPYWRSETGSSDGSGSALGDPLVGLLPRASERAGEAAASLPAGFDEWFGRCVARDPGVRFPEGGAACDALAALLAAPEGKAERAADVPPAAVPPLVMTAEPPRPTRWPFIVVGGVLAIIAAGITWWIASRSAAAEGPALGLLEVPDQAVAKGAE